MKAPQGLNAAGRRSFRRAADALGTRAEQDIEALERYARLVDMAAHLRDEWTKAGCPVTTTGGSTGQVLIPHPLPKMIRDAERSAATAWTALKVPRPRGRPQGAASAPDRTAGPPRLTRVE
jgi:hypothetical protein